MLAEVTLLLTHVPGSLGSVLGPIPGEECKVRALQQHPKPICLYGWEQVCWELMALGCGCSHNTEIPWWDGEGVVWDGAG